MKSILRTFGHVIAATVIMAGSTAHAEDKAMQQLSPANQAIAQRMLASVARWNEKYQAQAAKLNGGAATPETLHDETEYSIYDVWVTRGPVIEKLGSLLAEAKKGQPGRSGPALVWSRFYSLDYHAKNPLVGMLHSALVLQFYEDGTGFVGGWLGVMNGTRNAEDMAEFARVVDAGFAKYGRDPAMFHKMIMMAPENTDPVWRRQPDPSGVSLYGPQTFPGDVARSYELAENLFEQVNDEYLKILARRAKQAYTAQDEALRDDMRKRWLTDQLFVDPFASKVVPHEVGWLSNMPPAIRF